MCIFLTQFMFSDMKCLNQLNMACLNKTSMKARIAAWIKLRGSPSLFQDVHVRLFDYDGRTCRQFCFSYFMQSTDNGLSESKVF